MFLCQISPLVMLSYRNVLKTARQSDKTSPSINWMAYYLCTQSSTAVDSHLNKNMLSLLESRTDSPSMLCFCLPIAGHVNICSIISMYRPYFTIRTLHINMKHLMACFNTALWWKWTIYENFVPKELSSSFSCDLDQDIVLIFCSVNLVRAIQFISKQDWLMAIWSPDCILKSGLTASTQVLVSSVLNPWLSSQFASSIIKFFDLDISRLYTQLPFQLTYVLSFYTCSINLPTIKFNTKKTLWTKRDLPSR